MHLPRYSRRLFVTVWLVYTAFLTTNVMRETYLAVALGGDYTIRVDPYLELHPDLFEIPGRGGYINSNPGTSFLGAIPYLVARPLIAGVFTLRPDLAEPKPPASYDDPRPNRTRFMNEMRARGLDVRLALAALVTGAGLMATLGAAAAVLLYAYLRRRYGDTRQAIWFALLYAFATPMFFRSAYLNQNALLAHLVLAAWLALTWPGEPPEQVARPRRWFLVGALLGFGLLVDYSAAPLALVFGGWAMLEGWQRDRLGGMVRLAGSCLAGSIGPVLVLLGYQWLAFGVPWYPAQHYMPATEYSVIGWNGMAIPTLELLWGNLADPAYGLFAFCPMLVAALAAPFRTAAPGDPTRRETAVIMVLVVALWVFSSANQFASLQWNSGVRYLVPIVPVLFLLLVAVMRRLPRWANVLLVAPTLVISVAVAMMREDVISSLRLLWTIGPTLPILVVLQKTAASYAPFLAGGVQPYGVAAVVLLVLVVLVIWRIALPPADEKGEA